MFALLAAAAMFAGHACGQAVDIDRQHRADTIKARMIESLAKVEEKLKKDPGPVEIRELTNGALVAATIGNPAQAERLFRLAFDEQNMMPGAAFGEMPWNLKKRTIHDANSIDFATESLGPLLIGHLQQFSPSFQKYLQDHGTASLAALARHNIPVTYSNIYTMNFSNIILIAEALHDDAMMQRGYRNLDLWLDYTGRSGIHEFDSPTYNSVVLSALMMTYQYSTSNHVHQKSSEALRFLWTDLTANYFAAGKKIAGAHSRDYNFVYGTGGIDVYYYYEGVQADFSPGLALERAFLLESTRPGGYRSEVKSFSPNISRVVTQHWDENPQKYRYTYVTPDFALGIANGGNYGPQDKMFAFDFAPLPKNPKMKLPNVYLATTSTGLPYGQNKSTDKSGHSKPHHLNNNLAAVQSKGFALLVSQADPKSDEDAAMFYADIVLPAAAELTIDGHNLVVDKKLERKIKPGETIGLRLGNACLALRPFTAEGKALDTTLRADAESLDLGAIRLSTVFARRDRSDPMRSAYLVNAQHCGPKGNVAEDQLMKATNRSATVEHTWTVEARLDDTELAIDYDLDKHTSKATRVNGEDFTTPALRVTEQKASATQF